MNRWNALVFVGLMAVAAASSGHGEDPHASQRKFDASKVEATPFGQQGDPRKVGRTIRIDMADTMRFTPAALTVRRGETVRFLVRNNGRQLHEMVLGTRDALRQHAELMKKFPEMEHDDAHMAHVKPSRTGEIVWQFTKAGEFEFACLLPGHFEADMVGRVTVK